MTKFFNARTLGITFAAAALLLSNPASAQTSTAPISVTVSYGDLDLGHAAGAQALLQRIERAADQACGWAPDLRLLAERAAFEQCRKTAITTTVARIDAPMLTALAGSRGQPERVAGR
jgi:UrcA family protein